MKRIFSLSLLALAIPMVALAQTVISADDLIKDAAKLDTKVVTVKGTVAEFKQKTSRKGNPYYTFTLKTKVKETPVNVYGRGTLEKPLKDGSKVEITGTFRKEKEVSGFTVKNEVDVTPKEGEKPKIKVTEPGK
ncbi:MAG TPA: hypothetical protein PKA27_02640 [Fimbriimonadaceae bacterium]|nr:hypothetical protein [Fimbriimonadaceae bacterium]